MRDEWLRGLGSDTDLPAPDVRSLGAGCTAQVWGALDERRPAVCVMGTFDGLHIGHASLIASAAKEARELGAPLVALTFTPAPDEVVRPGAHLHLSSAKGRVAALLAAGVEAVVAFDFTPELASLSADVFLREVMLATLQVLTLHVGGNFRLGRGGETGAEELAGLASELGFALNWHPLVRVGGEVVSSTRVRRLLEAGDVAGAAELLGRYYRVRGTVGHGRGEGTSFGFPTANVSCEHDQQMPAEGVYACYLVVDGLAWSAAVNVGAPPTFAEAREHFLEANLIGFEGDLYGRAVDVAFVEFLRPSRPFDSIEELEETVQGNIAWVAGHLGTCPQEVRA